MRSYLDDSKPHIDIRDNSHSKLVQPTFDSAKLPSRHPLLEPSGFKLLRQPRCASQPGIN